MIGREIIDLSPRPSTAERWLHCHGSLRLSQGIVEATSDAASRGTFLHEVAATWLRSGAISDALNQQLDSPEQKALRHYVTEVTDQQLSNNPAPLLIEERIEWLPGLFGTADAALIGREIQIHDLKFHAGRAVSPDANPQLSCYALGLRRRAGRLNDPVRLFIHQGTRTLDWLATDEYLRGFEVRVLAAMEAAVKPDHELRFRPHINQCRYCPALAVCAAAKEYIDVSRLHEAQMPQGDLQGAAELAAAWAKAVTAKTLQMLTVGDPVEGWKLVKGRAGSRQWKAESDVIAELKKARCKIDQIYDSVLKSPAQLEKSVSDKVFGRVADFIFQPVGKPTLAPENDPRPALEVIKFEPVKPESVKSYEDFL